MVFGDEHFREGSSPECIDVDINSAIKLGAYPGSRLGRGALLASIEMHEYAKSSIRVPHSSCRRSSRGAPLFHLVR